MYAIRPDDYQWTSRLSIFDETRNRVKTLANFWVWCFSSRCLRG